jgi:1A family penicillin-binding protein
MPKRKYFRKILLGGKYSKILLSLVVLFLTGLLGAIFTFIMITKDFPRPENLSEHQIFQSTKIYDRTGTVLLYELYGEEKRTVVPLDTFSKNLINAVIATEDADFYNHHGIDFKSIVRAILTDLRLGAPLQGASTISQQLIRSSFLTREKTAIRKTKEIILTLELERRYSKDTILELYLNQVPFGANTYGAEAASETYFQKPVSDVSLAEAATLAAIIQSPSYLSPYGNNLDKLLARKDFVLGRMNEEGFITKEQKDEARKEEIKFSPVKQTIKAPHFVMYIKQQLEEKYGEDYLKEEGLKVYTTLNYDYQKIAEKAILEGATTNKNYKAYNSALISLDPKTGEILAMVGSKDYFGNVYPEGCTPGKNCLFEPYPNVTIANRQPGSSFKPFAYATAFKKGYSDKTIVVDELTNFGNWGGSDYIPQNYDLRFRGPVTLRTALAQSLNIPAVKVLAYMAGIEDSIQTAKDMGITTLTKPSSFYGLSLVLGGGEVKLLDMASAYGVFATDGYRSPYSSILKIEDSNGNIIEKNNISPRKVLDTGVAQTINSILSDNQARAPVFGLNSALYIPDYEVAAKTGTTSEYKDGWIIGYTPSIVTGVWAGNNNNTPMIKGPGVSVSGPIWKSYMEQVLINYPKENFSTSEIIEE